MALWLSGGLRLVVVLSVLAGLASCSDDGSSTEEPSATTVGSDVSGGTTSTAPPVVECEGRDPQPAGTASTERTPSGGAVAEPSFDRLVPVPSEVSSSSELFTVGPDVELVVTTAQAETAACLLSDLLAGATGEPLAVRAAAPGEPPSIRQIRFEAVEAGSDAGPPGPERPEGYHLSSDTEGVIIRASTAAGHGWAVQTLVQSASPGVHLPASPDRVVAFPTGTVTDSPRFGWRGLMVDIARHYFDADELVRVLDLMAAYKLNVLHLHLSDDQGWRLAIDAYPALTEIGAATEVGGGPGGFLTKDDYRRIVAHAERRGITVVPEIDMPGHTNAALTAVPELNCDGIAPDPYTGTQVGFSSLCIGDPDVDQFVRTVLAELAELTPGPYLHVGGDEAHATSEDDYRSFTSMVLEVVRDLGKVPIGWEEIGRGADGGEMVVQHWRDAEAAEAAVRRGASVVLTPAPVLYFDMAYGPFAPAGNDWAGTTDTREVYDWEPLGVIDVEPGAILGIEAALWTELIETPEDIQLRLLPRLPALAEVAWSSPEGRSWDDFRGRLALHATIWTAAGLEHVSDPGLE